MSSTSINNDDSPIVRSTPVKTVQKLKEKFPEKYEHTKQKDVDPEDELISGEVLEEEFLDDIHSENLQPSFSSLNNIPDNNPAHKSKTFQYLDRQQLSIISSRSEEESEDEHKLKSLKQPKKSAFNNKNNNAAHYSDMNYINNEEDQVENTEKIKSIKRRHNLIGKKTYDDQELAKIDLKYGLDYLLKKSKDLKERIENGMISKDFFDKSTYHNKHFLISFSKFLIKLIKEDDLYPDFKMMTNRLLHKIENFVLSHLEIEARNLNLQKEYELKKKQFFSDFDERITDLKEELSKIDEICESIFN